MQRAAEKVGIAAFDAICSAQKDRRLGASLGPYLTLPYLILPSEGANVGAIWCMPNVCSRPPDCTPPLTTESPTTHNCPTPC